MSELRRAERTDFVADVQLVTAGQRTPMRAWGRNISESGMFLQTTAPFVVGQKVALRFHAANSSPPHAPAHAPVLVRRAEIAWVRPFEPVSVDGNVPGVGIRFLNLEEEGREVIRQIVDEKKHDTVPSARAPSVVNIAQPVTFAKTMVPMHAPINAPVHAQANVSLTTESGDAHNRNVDEAVHVATVTPMVAPPSEIANRTVKPVTIAEAPTRIRAGGAADAAPLAEWALHNRTHSRRAHVRPTSLISSTSLSIAPASAHVSAVRQAEPSTSRTQSGIPLATAQNDNDEKWQIGTPRVTEKRALSLVPEYVTESGPSELRRESLIETDRVTRRVDRFGPAHMFTRPYRVLSYAIRRRGLDQDLWQDRRVRFVMAAVFVVTGLVLGAMLGLPNESRGPDVPPSALRAPEAVAAITSTVSGAAKPVSPLPVEVVEAPLRQTSKEVAPAAPVAPQVANPVALGLKSDNPAADKPADVVAKVAEIVSAAAPAESSSLHVERGRIVVPLVGGKVAKTFTLENPSRIVVDLVGAELPETKTLSVAAHGVSLVRYGRPDETHVRVVVEVERSGVPTNVTTLKRESSLAIAWK